jgi:toxin ParE1/3/4
MKRYRISPAARDDLKQISRYIAVERQSPQGAKRLRGYFLDSFRLLAEQPLLGQTCLEYGANMRIWPVGNYVVLYQPSKDGIDIVQVAHGARDLPAVVRKPPEPD